MHVAYEEEDTCSTCSTYQMCLCGGEHMRVMCHMRRRIHAFHVCDGLCQSRRVTACVTGGVLVAETGV